MIFSSCQQKEIPETEEPPPTTGSPINTTCPTCNWPDSVWSISTSGAHLNFRFKFDSTQLRLDQAGLVSTVLAGNAAQSPRMNHIAANYIELLKNDTTKPGEGSVLYKSEETFCSGNKAIVFCKLVVVKENELFFSIPLSQVPAGNYKWLRISLAYQNFNVKVRTTSAGLAEACIASFTGYNTYVSKYKMNGVVMTPTLNGVGDKLQGYWGYYSSIFGEDFKIEGQAPHTTVVNPNTGFLNTLGSSLVYGEFYNSASSVKQTLNITGLENQDINVTINISTNKCFEWKEKTFDGIFQPEIGETIYDLGMRGIIPKY